ncbi:MAG: hypothetical protein IJR34_06275, partial [Bacteroidales bacterium]|nr:hypothetical protein [Bacteroidales bacterium]
GVGLRAGAALETVRVGLAAAIVLTFALAFTLATFTLAAFTLAAFTTLASFTTLSALLALASLFTLALTSLVAARVLLVILIRIVIRFGSDHIFDVGEIARASAYQADGKSAKK